MASFSIPLSGLSADSTALNTIANDLSNMNTTAFKAQTTNFSDLFYQQVGSTGSGNQIQVGDGAKVASNITRRELTTHQEPRPPMWRWMATVSLS
jgi:flagellar hook protein FlgE